MRNERRFELQGCDNQRRDHLVARTGLPCTVPLHVEVARGGACGRWSIPGGRQKQALRPGSLWFPHPVHLEAQRRVLIDIRRRSGILWLRPHAHTRQYGAFVVSRHMFHPPTEVLGYTSTHRFFILDACCPASPVPVCIARASGGQVLRNHRLPSRIRRLLASLYGV